MPRVLVPIKVKGRLAAALTVFGVVYQVRYSR